MYNMYHMYHPYASLFYPVSFATYHSVAEIHAGQFRLRRLRLCRHRRSTGLRPTADLTALPPPSVSSASLIPLPLRWLSIDGGRRRHRPARYPRKNAALCRPRRCRRRRRRRRPPFAAAVRRSPQLIKEMPRRTLTFDDVPHILPPKPERAASGPPSTLRGRGGRERGS